MGKLDKFKLFDRSVEVGRVIYISFGPDRGKLAVIVDIIDQNRALIDGPSTGVIRQEIGFKAIHLTRFKINIHKNTSARAIRKMWKRDDVIKKWSETAWARKLASREKREKMTDFDRFKVLSAKRARNKLINEELFKLKSSAKAAVKAKKTPKPKKVAKPKQ